MPTSWARSRSLSLQEVDLSQRSKIKGKRDWQGRFMTKMENTAKESVLFFVPRMTLTSPGGLRVFGFF